MGEHECIRTREIEELTKKIENIDSRQYTDHDLLIRIETKSDNLSKVIETLVDEVKLLTTQPAKRFAEFKMAVYVGAAVTLVTVVIPFLMKTWVNGGM